MNFILRYILFRCKTNIKRQTEIFTKFWNCKYFKSVEFALVFVDNKFLCLYQFGVTKMLNFAVLDFFKYHYYTFGGYRDLILNVLLKLKKFNRVSTRKWPYRKYGKVNKTFLKYKEKNWKKFKNKTKLTFRLLNRN